MAGIQSEKLDASYYYYVGLLELALSKSASPGKKIKIVSGTPGTQMLYQRMLIKLNPGENVDVFWTGTTKKKEQDLRPIRIPLFKGLLGFRVSLMHKDLVDKFDSISSIQDILQYSVCQGQDWPDGQILENAGFKVKTTWNYEALFKLTANKRCDFFPRGINEARSEYLASHKTYPNLKLYTNLIIYYPLPMYYFVHRDNKELADLITTGLEKAIDDGSFDEYMRTNEVTKHLFPVKNWINAKYIVLTNPLAPDNLDTKNSRYWIQFSGENTLK